MLANKQSSIPRVLSKAWQRRRLAIGIVIVAGIGLFGAYQVISSSALSSTEAAHWSFVPEPGNSFIPQGQSFGAKATMSLGDYTYSSPQQIILVLGYDSTRIDLVNVTCKTSWGCIKSSLDTQLMSGHAPGFGVCLNVPSGTYSPSNITEIYTATFKAKTNIAGSANWWTTRLLVAPGTCESNPAAQNFVITVGNGSGVCGGPQWDACDRGPNPGSGDFIGFGSKAAGEDGNGQQGTSPQPNTSTKGGGSSSNNQAVKQSSEPNSVPSSTGQGDAPKQPMIEPSPFYDGKLYAPGSDSTASIGNITVAGRTVNGGWMYAVVAVVIMGIGSVVLWRWRRGRPKAHP